MAGSWQRLRYDLEKQRQFAYQRAHAGAEPQDKPSCDRWHFSCRDRNRRGWLRSWPGKLFASAIARRGHFGADSRCDIGSVGTAASPGAS
jgi:hypothetical protein